MTWEAFITVDTVEQVGNLFLWRDNPDGSYEYQHGDGIIETFPEGSPRPDPSFRFPYEAAGALRDIFAMVFPE